jgi:hypothetical protein
MHTMPLPPLYSSTMEFIKKLFLYTGVASSMFLVLGLFKPWVMVWWEDIQNRKKVIKIYGSVAVTCFIGYVILYYI